MPTEAFPVVFGGLRRFLQLLNELEQLILVFLGLMDGSFGTFKTLTHVVRSVAH